MADLSASPLAEHFEQLYRLSDDPWATRARWYEARKRALTLACLPKAQYEAGFEPGCANGELSAALASRCRTLLVSDLNATAVELARNRLRALPQVHVEQRAMPHQWPQQRFDLVVISELAYYLSAADLKVLLGHIIDSLVPDATLLACHWRRSIEANGQSAERIHAAFNARPELTRLVSHREDDFILEVWSPDARSVAQREGMVPDTAG
jgi:SAM-dependent methyltransferase